MKAIKIIILSIISLLFLIGGIFYLTNYLKPVPGGISVETTPSSQVYINGKFVGETPYKYIVEFPSISLKLVPSNINVNAFETNINITSGVETIVKYEFGQTEEDTWGYVLTLNKIANNLSGVSVSTDPTNTQISIDGEAKGFSPFKTSNISKTKHKITVNKDGYMDKSLNVNIQEGYILNMFVKLNKMTAPLPSPEPVLQIKTYIKILDTPTGFLRIRTLPGTLGEEIAEVKPGSKYLFLETDEKSGWHKVQFKESAPGLPDGISGWVSSQYSEKIDE